MRRHVPAVPTLAVAGVLLLAACGSQGAAPPTSGPAPARASGSPRAADASSCHRPVPSSGAALPEESSGSQTDGVGTVLVAGCPVFEVTNATAQTLTYTITFQLLSDSGAAMASAQQTLPSVRPGRTVRQAVDPGRLPPGVGGVLRTRIIKVRSVPTTEVPSRGGPCPASGVHVYADDGDAAMGLRVVGLHLTNCGTRTYRLDGYPQLQLLDEGHRPVDGVSILHGGDAVAAGTGADGTPQPLALRPGESARAGLVWRNTTGLGSDPVNAPYVRVVARPGAATVTVTPELDLGTTGRLGVGAWERDDPSRR
ncbi:DUF4232 domain-containing protein [Peterkaempfera griseoplana]|uniref:DUF4232 domain-containing protein n=1 Tax=Peterkaempfera griseoplana TaxID=66896 RepID=UPI0006E461FE|nr:DUF4232 domain-containing protein [Peterkaempfera griseoplana]